jgi:hypothetical protein
MFGTCSDELFQLFCALDNESHNHAPCSRGRRCEDTAPCGNQPRGFCSSARAGSRCRCSSEVPCTASISERGRVGAAERARPLGVVVDVFGELEVFVGVAVDNMKSTHTLSRMALEEEEEEEARRRLATGTVRLPRRTSRGRRPRRWRRRKTRRARGRRPEKKK